MSGNNNYISLLALVFALGSCTRPNPAPPHLRSSMEEAEKSARGSWIRLSLRAGGEISGELVAVSDELVHVNTGSTIEAVKATDVTGAVISVYEGETGILITSWVLGELSTLSHGFFLVFSVPIWFIASAVTLRVQSGVGYEDISNAPAPPGASHTGIWSFMAKLQPYARFPQGLPPVLATPRGASGGLCHGDKTCDRKARCELGRGVCVPDETMGTPAGTCYPDGSCDPGLSCNPQTKQCALPAPPPPPAQDAPDAGPDAQAPGPRTTPLSPAR